MKKYRVGVDIGGTNVKIALVDFDGKIIYSNTVPTRAEMGYEAGVNNIKQAIKELMSETEELTHSITDINKRLSNLAASTQEVLAVADVVKDISGNVANRLNDLNHRE